MKRKKRSQEIFNKASALLMILAMCWLTISIAFTVQLNTYAEITSGVTVPAEEAPEDNTNPYGNNTEEKAPSGNNTITEDYLHLNFSALFQEADATSHKHHDDGDYSAYHGELLVPPPNA